MEKGRYWYRRVPGTGSRYVPIDWRGLAAIAAVPVITLILTFATFAIVPWLALVVGPMALIAALGWLFTMIGKRVEPYPPSDP